MKKLLGSYFLGRESVDLFADAEHADGEALLPGKYQIAGVKGKGEIVIGIRGLDWPEVIDNLLHETFEYAFAREHVRFVSDIRCNRSTSHGFFFFDHDKFSEICAMVAEFITPGIPELSEFYSKAAQRRKKKRKRISTSGKKRKVEAG